MTPNRGNLEIDLELFADMTPKPVQAQAVPDEATKTKARFVIRQLSNAGLKKPYGFEDEDAAPLWAARLGRFSTAVLTEAIKEFVTSPGSDFPSLGDVETAADYVAAERLREEQYNAVGNVAACDECDDVHWIRVQDMKEDGSKLDSHHVRPCPRCPEMRERSDLYDDGHFTMEHVDRGGCPRCWEYHPSLRHKAKRTTGRR